jgi:hypothetical protein
MLKKYVPTSKRTKLYLHYYEMQLMEIIAVSSENGMQYVYTDERECVGRM